MTRIVNTIDDKNSIKDKNLGWLWLAYTELQSDFYMLQLIYVDSRHFTQSYLSLGWSDLHEIKNIIFCISSSD